MPAVLAALASGCAGDEAGDAPVLSADPATALAQSATRLRERGTFTFEASFTRVLATAPDDIEEYATAIGALDLTTGAGRAELELGQLFPGQEGAPFDEPAKLRWAGESITVELEGRTQTVSRAHAQDSGGLIGRYADEVESLDDVLAKPLQARLLGREDGIAHYAFAYGARAAGRLGIPAELDAAFEQALHGPRLGLEAWLGEDGLPHRIGYAIHLKPLRSNADTVLPRRTVRVTYELDDFGDEYDPDS